jgi:hypothetical protein
MLYIYGGWLCSLMYISCLITAPVTYHDILPCREGPAEWYQSGTDGRRGEAVGLHCGKPGWNGIAL